MFQVLSLEVSLVLRSCYLLSLVLNRLWLVLIIIFVVTSCAASRFSTFVLIAPLMLVSSMFLLFYHVPVIVSRSLFPPFISSSFFSSFLSPFPLSSSSSSPIISGSNFFLLLLLLLLLLSSSFIFFPFNLFSVLRFLLLQFVGKFSFMGNRIIDEVIKELLPQGLLDSKQLLFAGSR